MSFLAPVAFWIAAGVVPALVILYFLKLRRREEWVPSTLLWKRAVQDLQVNAPFQRLRKNLLLFLQLLVLLLGIVALARPIVETTLKGEESVVLLIDRSASMNTREGDQTRLELAKEQAVRLVKTLNRTGGGWFTFGAAEPKTRAMVIAFSDRAQVVSPFTTNTSELVDLIRAVAPTDGRTNMREALELAEAYITPARGGMDMRPVSAETPSKIVLISDGGVTDLGQLVLKAGTMELLKIGQTRDNVGITVLRTRRNYERPEMLDVFLQVQNFGPEPIKSDVALYVDGRLRAVKTVELTAARSREGEETATQPAAGPEPMGYAASLSFGLMLDRAALLEVRLSRDDALAVDNRAFSAVTAARELRVLLVTERSDFLESVLLGLPIDRPDNKVPKLTPEEYEAAPTDKIESEGRSAYDVVIFDRHSTGRLPAGNYLFFESVPQIEEIQATESEELPRLIWWDETHPVLRHVSLEYVYVKKALVLQAPPEAEILIEGSQGPVLVRYAKDGRHYLVMSFSVEQTTWWSKPSFPVFVYNALRYLGSGGVAAEQGPTRPGDALRIPLAPEAETAEVVRPDGSKVKITAGSGRFARFAGTYRAGVYRVDPDNEQRAQQFAVNLEDADESDIAPRGNLKIGAQSVVEVGGIRTATPEIWRWFIGIALLIALLEWYIYNRRVMI